MEPIPDRLDKGCVCWSVEEGKRKGQGRWGTRKEGIRRYKLSKGSGCSASRLESLGFSSLLRMQGCKPSERLQPSMNAFPCFQRKGHCSIRSLCFILLYCEAVVLLKYLVRLFSHYIARESETSVILLFFLKWRFLHSGIRCSPTTPSNSSGPSFPPTVTKTRTLITCALWLR